MLDDFGASFAQALPPECAMEPTTATIRAPPAGLPRRRGLTDLPVNPPKSGLKQAEWAADRTHAWLASQSPDATPT